MAGGSGLSDAYTATLTRLKAQKGSRQELGFKALMWVSYSERPLRAKELCHALGVEIGSTDLDPENIPSIRTLLSSCLGLLTVEASSSTVRLVHFTLHDHLLRDRTLFHNPHPTITEICLTYLNFTYVRDLPPQVGSAPSTFPLLEYASCYWGEHARRGITERAKSLALGLLDRFDEHISAQLLLLHNYQYAGGSWYSDSAAGGPIGFTGLHGVAFLGISELVIPVLRMKKWDASVADGRGRTALIWAAQRGRREVVAMLLEREDVDPDHLDAECGRTPLSWAAGNGHDKVVKMLLERGDVNPDQEDTDYHLTPLLWAALGAHEGVVKTLLELVDVNPNHADTKYGRTPLSWAAQRGREGVVKILLERDDVNFDHADTGCGRRPLTLAAENGHGNVVKMLLAREGVNPDQPDTKYGRTPLSWAAQRGREGVVKIILERADVNPNHADTECGSTPLTLAAENGHDGVVKVLLKQEGVNPDQPDSKFGRTPPSWAAQRGVKGLLRSFWGGRTSIPIMQTLSVAQRRSP